LPFASSLCGACAEVCPVKIDIPQVLLDLRSEVKKSETREKANRLEKFSYRMFAWMMTHPRIYALAGWMARHAPVVKVGPIRAWTSQRDLPPMPRQSFRDRWSRR
jgi:L-lactate dehydrogenase complex protein LldF